MIALLAAVPEETTLIRESLQTPQKTSAGGHSLISGTLSGQRVCLTHSGIGKAAAASAATTLLHHCQPQALLLFGCGGAYPSSGLQIGDLAFADTEIFGDEGVATPEGFQDLEAMGLPMSVASEPRYNVWPTDTGLLNWAASVIPGARRGAFVTVSTCTGTTKQALELEEQTEGICENMEGAAVALACTRFSVPMLEVRGISNMVEDRDASRWDLPAGMMAAQKATIKLLSAWQEG